MSEKMEMMDGEAQSQRKASRQQVNNCNKKMAGGDGSRKMRKKKVGVAGKTRQVEEAPLQLSQKVQSQKVRVWVESEKLTWRMAGETIAGEDTALGEKQHLLQPT